LVLPGDRSADIVAFEAAMVDFFVDAAELLGVPKSVAAIYGIVFASPVPLSFADIEARLDISKGSISQGLRVLREVGALRAMSLELGAGSSELGSGDLKLKAGSSKLEAATPSARGVLYQPDLELRKLVGRFLENRLQKQLTSGSTRLTSLTKAVPGRNGEAAVLRDRLKQLQNWHSKARALLPIAKTFLKLGAGS
jgi:DNA-binding transcriptional ArsR family regulator